jgi:hypothetical protein
VPRKRRHSKRRELPAGLAAISLCERSLWRSHGPLLEDDERDTISPDFDALYTIWPDWPTWAEFYAVVRDELYAPRPSLRDRSVAEACYLAMLDGADPDMTRDRVLTAREDPRKVLCRAN